MDYVQHWLDDVAVLETGTAEGDNPNVYGTAAPAAAVAPATQSILVDLYDSRVSHHMSPHREHFATFSETAPKTLNAAN